jgi:Ca2+-transporting ATPase
MANSEQFQITVNITAVVLTFVTAVVSSGEKSVLTAVQLLWVNLIMDTFAALALATDPPAPSILDRKPEPKSAPLITLTMWKMIIGQSIFQLVVTFVLFYVGPTIFNNKYGGQDDDEMRTLVFNTFVWMQIFNQYNSRRLDNGLNIFEGIHKNFFFIGIQFIICAGQVLIVFVGGAAFAVTRIDGEAWAISIVLGLLSIPFAILIRLIPDGLVRKCIPEFLKPKAKPDLLVSDEELQYAWNPALEDIRQDLAFLKLVRGGRLNMLKYKLQHPRELIPRSRSGSRTRSPSGSMPHTPDNEQNNEAGAAGEKPPATPDSRRSGNRRRGRSRSNSAFGPAAAMAGIVAGSIAGWSPIERREGDGFGRLPVSDRSGLENSKGIEVHPDTKPSDPVLANPDDIGNKPPSQNTELTPALAATSLDHDRSKGIPRNKYIAP